MAPETITDIVVIGIIIISGLLALFQGLVKEVLSIGAWVGAIYATIYGFASARPMVKDIIPWPEAVDLATGIALFIGALVLLSIGAHLISKILHGAGAGTLDRTLGFVFGLVRGMLIVVVLFIGIMVYTMRAGKKIENPNYWDDQIGTLEWTLPNPPPTHTFETLPTREMWDKQSSH